MEDLETCNISLRQAVDLAEERESELDTFLDSSLATCCWTRKYEESLLHA